MKDYFVQLDGARLRSLKDAPGIPVEDDLRFWLAKLDGHDRYALLLAALPDEVDYDSAKRADYDVDVFLQAGGSADRLVVQIARIEGDECVMYNVSLHPTEAGAPESERVAHGEVGQHAMVRPEEVLTAEEALSIFSHYFHHDQTLPSGLWLRNVNSDAAAFQGR